MSNKKFFEEARQKNKRSNMYDQTGKLSSVQPHAANTLLPRIDSQRKSFSLNARFNNSGMSRENIIGYSSRSVGGIFGHMTGSENNRVREETQ